MIDVVGQSNFQKLFPKTAPSIIMFQDAGISPTYYRSFYELELWPKRTWLKGSYIPFNASDSYYTPEIRKSVLAVALMQKSIQAHPLNKELINLNLIAKPYFSPLALPVIYVKNAGVSYLLDDNLFAFKTMGLTNAVFYNSPVDMMKNSFSNGYQLSALKKKMYYENMELIDIHYDDMPDAPVLKTDLLNNKRNTLDEIAEFFKPEQPNMSMKMERVSLIKKPWKFSGSENIQISQAYVKNWVKGGQDSYSLLSDLRLKAVYSEGKIQWENTGIHKLGYMFLNGGSSGVNDDVLDITSKYGISASKHWYYSFLFNMKTQFFYGYDRKDVDRVKPISGIMSPGYFTLAIGMDYKRGKNFTLMISPVTSKLAVVLDTAKIDQRRYNIPDDKRSTFLTGASLYNNFTWHIKNEIKLTSAMNVFYDYFKKEDKVQSDWDLILDMRINLFLSMRVVANFRYFENESSDIQIRETMSLAFRYNF